MTNFFRHMTVISVNYGQVKELNRQMGLNSKLGQERKEALDQKLT